MDEPSALATFISSLGEFFTAMLGWIGDGITFVLGHPVLLFFVLAMACGTIIGMVKHWLPGRA